MKLEELKVGNEVIREDGGHYSLPSVVEIERLTPTQIIIGSEKFNRFTGKSIGNSSSWHFKRIHVPEEGELESVKAKLRKKSLCDTFKNTNWNCYELHILESVPQAIKTKP